VARALRDRRMQRALMQFFKPQNYFAVRKALEQAGRADLIGGGCDYLIPAQPPREAIEARRRRANAADHYHTVANPTKGEPDGERGLPSKGYRPGRRSAQRRPGKKEGGAEDLKNESDVEQQVLTPLLSPMPRAGWLIGHHPACPCRSPGPPGFGTGSPARR
jgi:hypothetical protein